MNKERKIPNFFIVGHMKTGTTALYYYFKEHPQVYVSNTKELSYFAKEFIEERWKHKGDKFLKHFVSNENQYLSFYKDSTDEPILLDASPNYIFSETAAKKIHDFNPNAKILIIFREPIDFMYSLHSGMLFDITETEEDFMKALSLEPERKKSKTYKYLLYKNWADYKPLLKKYSDAFPKENIKVMIYENIRDNTEKSLKELAEFLDIEYRPEIEFKKVNTNKKLVMGGAVKKIARIPAIYDLVRGYIPRNIYDKLFKFYAFLVYKNVPRKELSQKDRNILKEEMKNRVIAFEKYLKNEGFIDENTDLVKLWGYDEHSLHN